MSQTWATNFKPNSNFRYSVRLVYTLIGTGAKKKGRVIGAQTKHDGNARRGSLMKFKKRPLTSNFPKSPNLPAHYSRSLRLHSTYFSLFSHFFYSLCLFSFSQPTSKQGSNGAVSVWHQRGVYGVQVSAGRGREAEVRHVRHPMARALSLPKLPSHQSRRLQSLALSRLRNTNSNSNNNNNNIGPTTTSTSSGWGCRTGCCHVGYRGWYFPHPTTEGKETPTTHHRKSRRRSLRRRRRRRREEEEEQHVSEWYSHAHSQLFNLYSIAREARHGIIFLSFTIVSPSIAITCIFIHLFIYLFFIYLSIRLFILVLTWLSGNQNQWSKYKVTHILNLLFKILV